jgi:Nif-specific regulatory protein
MLEKLKTVDSEAQAGSSPLIIRESGGGDDLFTGQKHLPYSFSLREDENRDLKNAEKLFKASFIKQVLAENKGNKTEAAKALNIQRTYLSRLIKELDINISKE